jgi:hypothetical protein
VIPFWLHALSIIALLSGAACALVLLAEVKRHPQHMWIMDVVWPVTGLYAGPLALWGYYRFGRGGHDKPFAAAVGIGTTHCGAGCTLGDIVAEWLAFVFPALAVWFGWRALFAEKMFAVWVLDFISRSALASPFSISPSRRCVGCRCARG